MEILNLTPEEKSITNDESKSRYDSFWKPLWIGSCAVLAAIFILLALFQSSNKKDSYLDVSKNQYDTSFNTDTKGDVAGAQTNGPHQPPPTQPPSSTSKKPSPTSEPGSTPSPTPTPANTPTPTSAPANTPTPTPETPTPTPNITDTPTPTPEEPTPTE